mmetsp:Transcript_6694/g.17423  ORF Transcript_6694/g.17423 Transcript_6694/m.17423 type:complete len:240 (-) Transcript_6694:327-1046(-)
MDRLRHQRSGTHLRHRCGIRERTLLFADERCGELSACNVVSRSVRLEAILLERGVGVLSTKVDANCVRVQPSSQVNVASHVREVCGVVEFDTRQALRGVQGSLASAVGELLAHVNQQVEGKRVRRVDGEREVENIVRSARLRRKLAETDVAPRRALQHSLRVHGVCGCILRECTTERFCSLDVGCVARAVHGCCFVVCRARRNPGVDGGCECTRVRVHAAVAEFFRCIDGVASVASVGR